MVESRDQVCTTMPYDIITNLTSAAAAVVVALEQMINKIFSWKPSCLHRTLNEVAEGQLNVERLI